jgi:hypothetical protein
MGELWVKMILSVNQKGLKEGIEKYDGHIENIDTKSTCVGLDVNLFMTECRAEWIIN